MAKIDAIEIPKLLFDEGAAPATPASTNVALYAKADGLLYSKDDAGVETLVSGGAGSGAATTVATGTGALSPSNEGVIGYETTTEVLRIYDGQRDRSFSEVGWLPSAFPLGFSPASAHTSTGTLAANGGSLALAVPVHGHMLLESVSVRQIATSLARTWGWDLYVQRLNNGNSGENTLNRVAACSADDTFTPGAASTRTLTAGSAPVYLGPGLYWLVIQNRHATNSFLVGVTANSAAFAPNIGQVKTTTNPNGSTLDFVAATWTKDTASWAAALNGRVFGQTTAF